MKIVIAMFCMLAITGCSGQDRGKKGNLENKESALDTPRSSWEVRKEYDDAGNLIRYDSIYSWAYSNVEGDSISVNLDSIMDAFRLHFENTSPSPWRDRFSYFPEVDSLFMNRFFEDDYFFKNWQRDYSEMEEMMRKMDSSRNEFLKRFHPGLIESKEQD